MNNMAEFKTISTRLNRIDRLLRQLEIEVNSVSDSLFDQAISNRVENERVKSLLRVSLQVNNERKVRANEKIKELNNLRQ